jgi:hypothetical protein
MTVGDTAIKYQLGMFLLPLVGLVFGVFGRFMAAQTQPQPQPEPAQPALHGSAG